MDKQDAGRTWRCMCGRHFALLSGKEKCQKNIGIKGKNAGFALLPGKEKCQKIQGCQ